MDNKEKTNNESQQNQTQNTNNLGETQTTGITRVSAMFIIISAALIIASLVIKPEFEKFTTIIWELMVNSILCFAVLGPSFQKAYPSEYNKKIWNTFSIQLFIFSVLFFTIPSLTILLQIGFFIYVFSTIAKLSTQPTTRPLSNVSPTTTKDLNISSETYKKVSPIQTPSPDSKNAIQFVDPSSFDSMYQMSDDALLTKFITQELEKNAQYDYKKLIPYDIKRSKTIFSIIFAVMIFIYTCLIFFHFPIYTYVIGGIILIISLISLKSYDITDYLKKKVKERPDEKISNIVMNELQNLTSNNLRLLQIISILIAIAAPLAIFYKPVIIYEPYEDGYSVRYYAFGLTEFTKATIPETHNDKPILSLRGNTFSNMPFLEEVSLPDTIVEIRGQAFKNCNNLRTVNLPKNLTYLGGEAFQNDVNLESIELPEGIEEIKGNTFENCTSLKEIKIPDKVTRIGGHAFYECTNLSKVEISPNSELKEIGSSAFRRCKSLKEITVPATTIVNEKAFKESPTKINKYVGSTISNNKKIRGE